DQQRVVPPELEDDRLPGLDGLQQLVEHVAPAGGGLEVEEGEAVEAVELPLERREAAGVGARLLGHRLDLGGARAEEGAEPPRAVLLLELERALGGRLVEVERLAEREHVLGLDLVRVEVDLAVGRAAAAARALGVEREDLYPRPEELLETGHELGVLPVRLLPRLEPVLV